MKWFKASRQRLTNRHGPLLGRLAQRQKQQLHGRALRWGKPPRILMILRSDRFSDSTAEVAVVAVPVIV
jgi:hypothetical protein